MHQVCIAYHVSCDHEVILMKKLPEPITRSLVINQLASNAELYILPRARVNQGIHGETRGFILHSITRQQLMKFILDGLMRHQQSSY